MLEVMNQNVNKDIERLERVKLFFYCKNIKLYKCQFVKI